MPPTSAKRSLEEAESVLDGVKAIVLDIEGTITPITFVKDKLFPYVTENIESHLTSTYDEEETQEDISDLRALAASDKENGEDVVEIPEAKDDNKDEVIQAVIKNVSHQMDKDRKSAELKKLQGHIWREGYQSKKLEGELFEDVGPVLQQLGEEGFSLFIYSSGSIESQQLLLTHSTDGDLNEIFAGFFDTTFGPKNEAESYRTIKTEIEKNCEADSVNSEEILFLTDNPEEARAAREAGWQAVLVDRSLEQDDGIELDEETRQSFQVIENLHDLFGDDDLDEMEDYDGQVKRPRVDGNGEYDDEEDEGQEEGEEDYGDEGGEGEEEEAGEEGGEDEED
ncbi:enolase-phosphatase E1-like [Dreissena polymorpha]|uniref:Enolase-phosphatase E1 n=1 Tax=Dreissena polymorpha TaxID=45954 RepID=A0A9D4QWB2_DREPO|nr:enolase-phosphatase E1-like [Dreissena polymorpha]KAH3846046.1 hypothetical protein DPMN_088339 [Dreissena polymorpha]